MPDELDKIESALDHAMSAANWEAKYREGFVVEYERAAAIEMESARNLIPALRERIASLERQDLAEDLRIARAGEKYWQEEHGILNGLYFDRWTELTAQMQRAEKAEADRNALAILLRCKVTDMEWAMYPDSLRACVEMEYTLLRGSLADCKAELAATREELAKERKLYAGSLSRILAQRDEAIARMDAEIEDAIAASGFAVKPNEDPIDRLRQLHQALIVEHSNERLQSAKDRARMEELAAIARAAEKKLAEAGIR